MANGTAFGWQVENVNGTPVSGALIAFKRSGTSTDATTYVDRALTVPAANPIVADAAGWFNTYLDPDVTYDITVKSADGSITYQSVTIGPGEETINVSADEIRLSAYPATQAGFADAANDAISAGKWLNGEEIEITLASLMTINLTDELKWRNVRLKKPAQSSGDYEYTLRIDGPFFSNVTTLAANAAIGASSLTVSSATHIVAGAKYLLISDTDYNPDPASYGNAVAKKSEWVRVSKSYTSGTTVPLMQALQSSYTTAANARLYRFPETARIMWDNVVITGGGLGLKQGGVIFSCCVIDQMTNCGSDGNEFTAFEFSLCGFNAYISVWVKDSPLSGYGYGVVTGGCDAPLIDWVAGENVRHVVTRGASAQATLPFSGGNAYILGRGGHTASLSGIRCTGSIDDTHTGHIGHMIGTVTGDIVPGNAQEAITVESHGITYESVRVTGADNPVTVLYYGHPADEPPPVVSFGAIDLGYGGTGTNRAVACINRDASTRRPLHVQIESINGNWPALLYAGAEQGQVNVSVRKVTGTTRTIHSVEAVSSANGQAYVHIEHPDFVEDSGNASIYAVRADGDAWNTANAGQLGAIVSLGRGTITADNTAYYANDAQIVLNGTRGTSTKSLVGLGTLLIPNEIRSASLASGSSVSLTTDTTANVTTLTLEPGLWKVTGAIGFNPSGSTSITRLIAAINTASVTIPLPDAVAGAVAGQSYAAYTPPATGQYLLPGEAILDLRTTSGNTTVYLIARATFSASTLTAYGKLVAQRLA